MLSLVALAALGLWATMPLWIPASRHARGLGVDRPAYARRESAMALGYGVPRWEAAWAVEALIPGLSDPDTQVRIAAASGLAAHGAAAAPAIPALAAVAGDPAWDVRYTAAAALGKIAAPGVAGHDAALVALRRALDDPRPLVRYRAAVSLAEAGDPGPAAEAIADALAGPDDEVKHEAGADVRSRPVPLNMVLRRLGARLHDPDAATRDRAVEAIRSLAGLDAMRAALLSSGGSDDPRVRAWAAEALGRPGAGGP